MGNSHSRSSGGRGQPKPSSHSTPATPSSITSPEPGPESPSPSTTPDPPVFTRPKITFGTDQPGETSATKSESSTAPSAASTQLSLSGSPSHTQSGGATTSSQTTQEGLSGAETVLTTSASSSTIILAGSSTSLTPLPISPSLKYTAGGIPETSSTLLAIPSSLSVPPTISEDPANSNVTRSVSQTHAKGHSNTGAIVGGVVGTSVALLILLWAAVALVRRRIRARRTAPSAEFMHVAHRAGFGDGFGGAGFTPIMASVRLDRATTPSGSESHSPSPYHGTESLGDYNSEPPPPFTPGTYHGRDPVLEKVHAAEELREEYRRRESHAFSFRSDSLGDDSVEHAAADEKSEGGYGFAV